MKIELIIIAGLFLALLVFFIKKQIVKKSALKGKVIKKTRPDFIGKTQSGFPCVLVDNTKLAYATHVWRSSIGLFTLPDENFAYKVNIKHLTSDKIKMFKDGTELSIANLEIDSPVKQCVIADSINNGESVTVYVRNKTVKTKVKKITTNGGFQIEWDTQKGDSSGVVLNKNNELLGLVTHVKGHCNNLTLVKEEIKNL